MAQYNDHWVPYWLHCHVCQLEYDIVGKMETVEEDMKFIMDTTGLSATNLSLPWANRRGSSNSVSLEYFEKLSQTQIDGLYNIYQPDFEMFGYSAKPYYELHSKLLK